MPRATNKYAFESKIWGGLANLALQLTGNCGEGYGFRAVLNKEGCLMTIYSQAFFPDFRDRGKESEAMLFYDPFEGPEYQFIKWSNAKLETIERILNIRFTPEDFVAKDGSKLELFPSSHGVMF